MQNWLKSSARQLQANIRKLKLTYYLRQYKNTITTTDLTQVKSLALLRWDGKLGDTIIMGTFLALMAKYRPDINITILAYGFPIQWLKKLNLDIQIIECGKRSKKSAQALAAYQEQFDATIDLNSEFSYKELLALQYLKPKIAIGYDTLTPNAYDIKIPHEKINFQERYIACAQLFISKHINTQEISIPTPTFIPQNLVEQNQTQIALNLFGASKYRQFNYDSAKKFIHAWLKEWPQDSIVLIPVPGFLEFQQKLTAEIQNNRLLLPQAQPCLELTLGILAASSLCVTPDTSVVHMASCLNTPTLAIYSPNKTNYDEWKPLASKSAVIFNPTAPNEYTKVRVDDFKWNEVVDDRNKLLR